MFSFLKNHPFPVEAFFESSLVLTFSFAKEKLQPLIPECLVLDIFQDKWAFVAVAMVRTKALRPKGFPKFMGNEFFLVGYRIFVRYTNNAGKKLRGLYILKSESDKKRMEWLGNLFTHYNYSTIDIGQQVQGERYTINSHKGGFHLTANINDESAALPNGSPFKDWKEARRFAGPLPFTFSYNPYSKEVLTIEGVRQHWTPTPVAIIDYHFPFLESLQAGSYVLANAFIIRDIPYYWKKGKIESWQV